MITKKETLPKCGSAIICAQSASEKHVNDKLEERWQVSPCVIVPLMYRKILLTAVQCVVVVLCINWQTWLKAKATFGLVHVRYWRVPTALRYFEGLRRGSPSKRLNLVLGRTGEEMGWTPSLLYFCNKLKHILFVKETDNPSYKQPQDPKNNEEDQDLSWQRPWPTAEWEWQLQSDYFLWW